MLIHHIHPAQVIGDLKPPGFKPGYLLNFRKRWMKEGIKRVSV